MAKNMVLAGFHAVGARLRNAPDSILTVYVDPSRHDKRMVQMREELDAAGIRVMHASHERLSGMVSKDVPHQGIVAMAKELDMGMSFDELMDEFEETCKEICVSGPSVENLYYVERLLGGVSS